MQEEVLGQGSYGKVYLTDKNYAIKEIKHRNSEIDGSTIREIAYSQKLCCNPFIQKLIDVDIKLDPYSTDVIVSQVSEVATYGDLKHYIKDFPIKNIAALKDIAFQLSYGMAEIASKNL